MSRFVMSPRDVPERGIRLTTVAFTIRRHAVEHHDGRQNDLIFYYYRTFDS